MDDLTDRLIADAGPTGTRMGTATDLAERYGIDEDAMILVLVRLVKLGHVRREAGGTFYSARPRPPFADNR